MHESRRAGRLTSADTYQAQNQGFGLVHPNIHTINELLECIKGLVLWIQNYRIFRTQGNNKISERSPSKIPVSRE